MSLLKLNESIKEIEAKKGFDPVRFTLIQSMYQRLKHAQHETNQTLINRTQALVDEYKRDFEERQKNAESVLANTELGLSKHVEQANALMNHNEFKELENMLNAFKRDSKRQEPLSQLGNLKNEMPQIEAIEHKCNENLSLDEILFNQEQDARLETGSAPLPSGSDELKFELQSMKRFRESMKYFNIDKIINRAINDFPENAGPHNPHMLAIKSLMQMKELSPQYLRRFASYIETILWLEKNSTKLNRKKTP